MLWLELLTKIYASIAPGGLAFPASTVSSVKSIEWRRRRLIALRRQVYAEPARLRAGAGCSNPRFGMVWSPPYSASPGPGAIWRWYWETERINREAHP